MTTVAATDRMISGRKRTYSTAAGWRLSGTGELRGLSRRRGSDTERYVESSLLQDDSGDLTDARQKCLGSGTEPYHQDKQGNHNAPFARAEVGHVRADALGSFTIENTLIKPQEIAGGKDHAD